MSYKLFFTTKTTTTNKQEVKVILLSKGRSTAGHNKYCSLFNFGKYLALSVLFFKYCKYKVEQSPMTDLPIHTLFNIL